MKLSEYQGEAALDILADLIEPAGEIMSDKEIGEVFKENRFKAIGLAIKKKSHFLPPFFLIKILRFLPLHTPQTERFPAPPRNNVRCR